MMTGDRNLENSSREEGQVGQRIRGIIYLLCNQIITNLLSRCWRLKSK